MANVTIISHNRPKKIFSKFLFIPFKLYHICDKLESAMMKKLDCLFQEIDCPRAFWVADVDQEYLPQVADFIVRQGFPVLSAPANLVRQVWPWIEHNDIKIINRCFFDATDDVDAAISKFALDVSNGARNGADGVQVFVSANKLSDFVTALKPLRDDLFFDRFFSIGLDISEINIDMWDGIFDSLRAVHANAVLIMAQGDDFDRSSDFVGRVFTMLEKWNCDADLHMMFGKNTMQIIQTIRLVQKMRPDLIKKLMVFVRQ